MLTPEERAARRHSIGGSDVAPILGLSKYATPLDVYLEKTGLVTAEREPSEQMLWGNLLESAVRNEWERREGKMLATPPMIRGDEPWMHANVDALVVDNPNEGLEVKLVSGPACAEWGEPGTDAVPLYYLVQVYHYAIVTGRRRWYVAALFNGNALHTYVIDCAPNLMAQIHEAERRFWRCVQERTPPAPISPEDVAKLYPQSIAKRVKADERAIGAWQRLREFREAADAAIAQAEAYQQQLMEAMGEADTLVDSEGRVLATWRSQSRTSVDMKQLRRLVPEAVKQCEGSTSFRRFLLKEVK